MDLSYLRAHPEHLPTFLTHQRIRETPVAGGDTCTASRLTLDDGHSVFTKSWPEKSDVPRPADYFGIEAAGLAWLAEAAIVPEVIVALPELLALEWIDEGPATATAAERLGRELATMHRLGADSFGATPTGSAGWISRLALPGAASAGQWGAWFAQHRLEPYLRLAADAEALTSADVQRVRAALDRIAGYDDGEAPARLHGDLWPGNLLWGADGRVRLIDPAAQGGHRETDLATLALFGGAPQLDRIMAAYDEVWPLAAGWEARQPMHQLHLLLVHAALFGGAYREPVLAAAEAAVSA